MRICIINEYFYPDNTGGTGTVLSNLARELLDWYEDVEVEVITSRNQYRVGGKPLPAREDWQGIHIQRLASPRPGTSAALRLLANSIFSALVLLQLLRQRRYDVLLVGTAPPTAPLATWIYKRLTGTPYVYVTYDLEPDRVVALEVMPATSAFVKALRWLQNRWLHAASRVVVLGRCMHRYISTHYDLPAEKLITIPIGFGTEQVVPSGKQTRFRAKYGLRGFLALYAGNFGRYHNFDAILDAAKALSGQNITFALVGQGAQRQHILERVETESIENVKVFPFVPFEEFSDMIASADVCLVTLEKGMEGLCVPSKLYSNMAAGRPTLALVGAASEVAQVVTESQSGIQVEPGDTKTLIEALNRLIACPEESERMGENARRTLEEKYATAHIAAKYYRVFVESARARTEMLPLDSAAVSDRAIVRERTVVADEEAPVPAEIA